MPVVGWGVYWWRDRGGRGVSRGEGWGRLVHEMRIKLYENASSTAVVTWEKSIMAPGSFEKKKM